METRQTFNPLYGLFLSLIAPLLFTSCQSNTSKIPEYETTAVFQFSVEQDRGTLTSLISKIYRTAPFASYDEIATEVQKAYSLPQNTFTQPTLKAQQEKLKEFVPSEVAAEALNKIKLIDPSLYITKSDYTNALLRVINSEEKLSLVEKDALTIASYISADLIELKYGCNDDATLKAAWWDKTKAWVKKQWNDWGKCAAGTVGGAGLGALAGAGTGSVIPALGTTAGAIAGGISGGLSGAAASC